MNIYNLIRTIRLQKGISATHVAKCLKMNKSQYCHLEKGRRRVTVELLIELASALDVDVRDFFKPEVVESKSMDIHLVSNDKAI